MLLALFNCILGSALSFVIGLGLLHLRASQVLVSLVASQGSGLIALLLTLRAERITWIRGKVLNRSLKTWIFFAGLYIGLLLLFSPSLREPRVMAGLIVPLILSNGLCIIVFGPIQDWIVRWEQRKASREAS